MFDVYVISSQSRKYVYVGLTNNLKRRFREHQEGKNKTTKSYRPFLLLHTERFDDRILARKREIFFKSGVGKEWIKNKFC